MDKVLYYTNRVYHVVGIKSTCNVFKIVSLLHFFIIQSD